MFIFLPASSYRSSSTAFLYSLYNIYSYHPLKLGLKSGHHNSAIYDSSSYGPTFGNGHDIYTASNRGHTYCGYAYAIPSGYSSRRSCTWFAGSYSFTLSDIEVFYEVTWRYQNAFFGSSGSAHINMIPNWSSFDKVMRSLSLFSVSN